MTKNRCGAAMIPPPRKWPACWPASMTSPTTDILLGLEGQAASAYFGAFGRMLHAAVPGGGFDFRSRNRRPPRDPVNALLSFAYAMLAKDAFSALLTVGFDPYLGFYHGGKHGRPSLALDLMEEFRAVIADSVVLTLVNNGMLSAADFIAWNGACQLTDAGRRTFFETYERRKSTIVTHPLIWLQDELRPHAGGAGPPARRLHPRRRAGVSGVHGAVTRVEERWRPTLMLMKILSGHSQM